MTFSEAIQSALVRKYASFQGRTLRSEFWWFMLAVVIATFVAATIDQYALGGRTILEGLVTLATVVPSLSVGARRLHDIDRSGWWQLLSIIPLIGTIVLIVWWAQAGTPGPNRFGEPPSAR
jgi:uncharacterized membrane protein YhaH (DUF805 family)